MIPTPTQLRAARFLLDIGQKELAEKSGISLRTMVAVEQGKGADSSREKVVDALGREGIELSGSPDGTTLTVRLRRS